MKKTISLLIAATLLTGTMGGTVFAIDNNNNLVNQTVAVEKIGVEQIYKNAYDLTIKALEVRTQEALTAARYAIWKLPAGYESAIGTFSAMLDDVQLELFRTFLTIFHVDGVPVKSLSQADINKGRGMLEGFYTWENNKQYCYTWSSCIDTYQVNVMKEVESALRKAQSSKLKADIAKARELMNVILTVKHNDGVLNWATTLNKELITLENSTEIPPVIPPVDPPVDPIPPVDPPVVNPDKDYVAPPSISGLNTNLRARYMQEFFNGGLYFHRNGKMIATFDNICNDLASGKLTESEVINKIESLRWEENFTNTNGIWEGTVAEIVYQYDKSNNAHDIYMNSIKNGQLGEYKAIAIFYDKETKQNKIVTIAINLRCQPF
ncbi:MAG: hypothetical protein RSA57_03700 [Cetobacterium sp.]|uniref:hypothetical protein n=1 Tax=Bacteria TaxID=2 RepID=UPI002FCB10BB